jgi:hypothetical protein
MDVAVVVEDWANLIDPATGAPKDGYYRHVARRASFFGPFEYAPNNTLWYVTWKVVYI